MARIVEESYIQDLCDWIINCEKNYELDKSRAIAEINADLENMPEVVRCKDCKHKTVTSDGMVCECALPTKMMQDYYIYGSTILARVEPDGFCSHGERKDNERKAD